jgi:hypothetical protein
MGASGFDLIAQEVQRLLWITEDLLAENRELRQQLTDLQAGRGIFLEIEGKRIALIAPSNSTVALAPSTEQQPRQAAQSTRELPQLSDEDFPIQPQNDRSTWTDEEQEEQEEKTIPVQSTFLEEIMIDEFAAALTSPMAVWQGPPKQPEPVQKPEQKDNAKELNADQMAALRRDLMGSFLLE